MLVTMPHRELGEVATIGNPMALSTSPPAYRRPPPGLGEHTAEILKEIGYADEDVARLTDYNPHRTHRPARVE